MSSESQKEVTLVWLLRLEALERLKLKSGAVALEALVALVALEALLALEALEAFTWTVVSLKQSSSKTS